MKTPFKVLLSVLLLLALPLVPRAQPIATVGLCFRISPFGLPSDFGFRPSDFISPPSRLISAFCCGPCQPAGK